MGKIRRDVGFVLAGQRMQIIVGFVGFRGWCCVCEEEVGELGEWNSFVIGGFGWVGVWCGYVWTLCWEVR